MIIVYKKEEGVILNKLADCIHSVALFITKMKSDITRVYPNYDETKHIVYMGDSEPEYPFIQNGKVVDIDKDTARGLNLIAPSDEPIWSLNESGTFIVDAEKLELRKQELYSELYELRSERAKYFPFEVNGTTYQQRCLEYDVVMAQTSYSELLTQKANGVENPFTPWRFDGIKLDATVSLGIDDILRLITEGKDFMNKHTNAQFIVYFKISGLEDTTNFDIVSEYDNALYLIENDLIDISNLHLSPGE